MNDDAQKAKSIIIEWLEGRTKDKGMVPLWDNYKTALCDDELVETYLKRLKNEKTVSAWNILAFYLTEMLKRADKTPVVDDAYGYIRNTVMTGSDDIEQLIRVAKDAQYRLDNKIGSSAIPDVLYSRIFINLADYYK